VSCNRLGFAIFAISRGELCDERVNSLLLRDALAVDALGVPELEARARAAGILGERQQISHAKVFKHAKKSLGIRSLRAGFGARSQRRWQLPRQSDPAAVKTESEAAQERRVPIPLMSTNHALPP
jgi:hypothetical protein